MLRTTSENVEIKGIVSAVPKNKVNNFDLTNLFEKEELEKTIKLTGVKSRHIATEQICTSDLCVAAAKNLLDDIIWAPETIDCLIFVSQTPDYILPATSCSIHQRLNLSKNCATFDVNLGCSGYVYGLWIASNLMRNSEIKRCLLLVGDTINRTVYPKDKATSLLFGDAGSATALEQSHNSESLYFVLGTDGYGANNLIIQGGGFRKPYYLEYDEAKKHLYMNGEEIFNFTIQVVPGMIEDLLKYAQLDRENVDYFVLHQANEFIIKHLAKKAKISIEKVPITLSNFGNTSSASIPLTISSAFSKDLSENKRKLIMSGFGVGYSWASVLADVGPLESIKLIEV